MSCSPFSGVDISGRDELFGELRRSPPAKPKGKLPLVAAKAVAAAATVFSLTGLFFCSTAIEPDVGVYSDEVTETSLAVNDVADPITKRIAHATSQRLQPTQDARDAARKVYEKLTALGVVVNHVVADPHGGVSLYAFIEDERRFARLLSTNENELVVTLEDVPSGTYDIWEGTAGATDLELERVVQFLKA